MNEVMFYRCVHLSVYLLAFMIIPKAYELIFMGGGFGQRKKRLNFGKAPDHTLPKIEKKNPNIQRPIFIHFGCLTDVISIKRIKQQYYGEVTLCPT